MQNRGGLRSTIQPPARYPGPRGPKMLMKLIVDTSDRQRVVGMHLLGPDAAEIIQGFAVAVVAGLNKEALDRTVGVHPSLAEEFVTMREPAREW